MCGHCAQNLLVLRSSLLRPDRDIRVGMDLYRRCAGFCLQVKGQRCYLSQNIGPAVAGSAGPAPPPLQLLYDNSGSDLVLLR